MTQNVTDRSYGIVPVMFVEGDWHFLLVKHLGGHWAFPKGHPEDRESPKEAASRELQEETGLTIKRFFQLYPFSEQYTFFHAGHRISKTVIYYLAEVEGVVRAQAEELLDAKLLSFEACCELISYPRSLQICQQSYAFLAGYSKREALAQNASTTTSQVAGAKVNRPPVPKTLISQDPLLKRSTVPSTTESLSNPSGSISNEEQSPWPSK